MAYKIAILVGSLRKESYNRKIARAMCAIRDDNLDCSMVEIGDLPLYNQEYDSAPQQPEQYVRFRDQIRSADGVLFVSPEYNRGIPGVLKNAIDVGSRPYGQSVFDKKPAAVVTASIGAIGGFGANHQIRQSCVFLNMPVMTQPEAYLGNVGDDAFDENGNLKDGGLKDVVTKVAHAFHDWVDMIHRSRAALASQAEMTEERPEPAKA
jgi:chromate reductase